MTNLEEAFRLKDRVLQFLDSQKLKVRHSITDRQGYSVNCNMAEIWIEESNIRNWQVDFFIATTGADGVITETIVSGRARDLSQAIVNAVDQLRAKFPDAALLPPEVEFEPLAQLGSES